MEPTTLAIASLAISAAGQGMSFIGQSQAANAQADYEKARAEQQAAFMVQNAEAANKALIEQYAQENQRQVEAQEATAVELQDLQIARLQREGEAVAQSEGAGANLAAVLGDLFRQEARFRDTTLVNLESERRQSQERMRGYRAEAENRINAVQPYIPQPVNRPSLLGTALSIGASATAGWGDYTRARDRILPKNKK